MEIDIRKARIGDAAEMAPRMRRADAAEVLAAGGYTPLAALEDSILMSGHTAWTVRLNGEIMAIYGVVPLGLLTSVVVPWALTTDAVDARPRLFYRLSKSIVYDLRRRYGCMTNMVDARYEKAIRWVKKLGFEVGPPVPYGIEGQKFHEIKMMGGC